MAPHRFAPRGSTEQIEEGRVFAPKFDDDGLIPAIVVDAWSAEVLMFAHMNEEALAHSIEKAEVWLYSRSRKTLWKKGETSGHTLRIREIRVDCDQDVLLVRVEQNHRGACHTGRSSCFYRAVTLREPAGHTLLLAPRDAERIFDPSEVYGGGAKRD
jgi:phosphoribosyl-AMP cyclohydrolase